MTKKTKYGEILPPEQRNRHDLTRAEMPSTGAMFFPMLRLKVLQRAWSGYGQYIEQIERVSRSTARMYDAAVDARRAIDRFNDLPAILEEDRFQREHERTMNAHRRDMELRRAQAERENFDTYGKANLAQTEANEALRLEVERVKQEFEKADVLLSQRALSQAQREAVIDNLANTASMAREKEYQARVAKRGGEEKLTAEDRREFAEAKAREEDMKKDLLDV